MGADSNQAAYDPGNAYAVPYMWGTNGFTYNVDMIKERMPDAPVDSLRMMFDPEVVSKFQDCGVSFLDSPEDVFPLALAYMGKDPTSQNPDDIVAATEMLMKVRPYIKLFDSQQYLNDLPNGDRLPRHDLVGRLCRRGAARRGSRRRDQPRLHRARRKAATSGSTRC